jgi:regulator of sigma E protease
MPPFLEYILYFLVTLGVLVFVHELGHFLAARLCGMRASEFAFGMGPRLFGYNRVNGFSLGKLPESVEQGLGPHTDYRVAAFPVGGYVKIAGMIDESFDTKHLEAEPQPWEFRARPLWQRMLVICAGVLMNILLALLIFWGINYVQGRTVRETTTVGYVAAGSPADSAGLQAGDRILTVNGSAITQWDEVTSGIFLADITRDAVLTLRRGGTETEVLLPRRLLADPTEGSLGAYPEGTALTVTGIIPGMPAERAGLKPLDVIVSLNGAPVALDSPVSAIVGAASGRDLVIGVRRGDSTLSFTTVPTAEGKVGMYYGPYYTGPTRSVRYSLFEAFPHGVRYLVGMTRLFLQQLWQLFTGRVAFTQSVGGPIKIAQLATQSAELGVLSYLGFMALLSITLAIMNILPFPALDGGHMVFLLYEAVFRREVPVRVRLFLQQAGMVLLLAFMVFVFINDIVNF